MWFLSSLPNYSSMQANQCSLSGVFLWRPKTVYRTVQRTRTVSVKVIYCCTGWKKRYSSSRQCTEGKVKSIHYSLLLMPFPLHYMKKMSAKINNDNTFSCRFAVLSLRVTKLSSSVLLLHGLNTEAGYATFKLVANRNEMLTVLVSESQNPQFDQFRLSPSQRSIHKAHKQISCTTNYKLLVALAILAESLTVAESI